MLAKKWMVFTFYLFLFCSFGYTAYQNREASNYTMILFGVMALLMGVQLVKMIVNKEKWNKQYVVADSMIINGIKNSLSLAYLVTVVILIILAIGISNNMFSPTTNEVILITLLISLFTFMTSQIIQRIKN